LVLKALLEGRGWQILDATIAVQGRRDDLKFCRLLYEFGVLEDRSDEENSPV
jgi:hypothetical protein